MLTRGQRASVLHHSPLRLFLLVGFANVGNHARTPARPSQASPRPAGSPQQAYLGGSGGGVSVMSSNLRGPKVNAADTNQQPPRPQGLGAPAPGRPCQASWALHGPPELSPVRSRPAPGSCACPKPISEVGHSGDNTLGHSGVVLSPSLCQREGSPDGPTASQPHAQAQEPGAGGPAWSGSSLGPCRRGRQAGWAPREEEDGS